MQTKMANTQKREVENGNVEENSFYVDSHMFI